MICCYKEWLLDIVLFVNEDGMWVVVEFIVNGFYISMDEGLLEVSGQIYCLLVGSFFEIWDGQIVWIMIYYNVQDWIGQVGLFEIVCDFD